MLNEVISAVRAAEETAERVLSVGEARAAALREEAERRGEESVAVARKNCLALRNEAAKEAEEEARRLHEAGDAARAESRRAWAEIALSHREDAVRVILGDLVG